MIQKINHDQLRRCLVLLWLSDIPACIVGDVGTGKTTAVEDLVKELDTKMENKFNLWKVFLGLIDATDIGGIPMKNQDGKIDYAPPRCLPFGTDESGIIFGDEYDRAAPDVQNAFNQILLGREIHNNVISDNAYVILAMNGEADSYTTPLSKAARNRVCTLFLSPIAGDSHSQWDEWARKNNVNSYVRGFARYRSDLIKDDVEYSELAMITPRSRDMAGRILDKVNEVDFKTDDILLPCLAGVIGTAAAQELIAFMEQEASLPDIKQLLDNPDKFEDMADDLYDRPDINFMLGISISNYVTNNKNYGEKAIKFFTEKFQPENRTWAVDNIVSSNPNIITTPEYKKFFNKQKTLMLD